MDLMLLHQTPIVCPLHQNGVQNNGISLLCPFLVRWCHSFYRIWHCCPFIHFYWIIHTFSYSHFLHFNFKLIISVTKCFLYMSSPLTMSHFKSISDTCLCLCTRGRRITSSGQRDLDQVAGRIVVAPWTMDIWRLLVQFNAFSFLYFI